MAEGGKTSPHSLGLGKGLPLTLLS